MRQELSKNKYLYKRLKLEEIKNPQYFFGICTESNLVKFLIRIFFNRENFIKIFDFRIISSLILRDLDDSKINKNSIFNTFLLLTLLIFLYRLSNKAIIEKKYLNLVKIVSGHINYYKYKEKNLEETFDKKNISTFTHKYLSENFDLERKKQYSIIRASLKKNLYIIPVDNKILIENSEWWKLWIMKEILPGWEISSNSINEIEKLLKKTNINHLNFFFKFYIINILCQNYDWENKFNSIFFKNSKRNKKLGSKRHKKKLEDTLVLQIFFAFCEKLLFEVENPLKFNNFDSIIELDEESYNTKFFFSIPLFDQEEINRQRFCLVKKNLIQNFKFWGEADPIIAKSYILIKKKGWVFFDNYAKFYIWHLYKKGLFEDKNDLDEIDMYRSELDIRLFRLKSEYNKEKILRVDESLSEILYKMSKYILYKIKNSNKLINNYKIIDQIFGLEKKKKTKIKKSLNLIEPSFVQSNKNFLKWFLDKKSLNIKDIEQNIIWDILFFNRNKKNIIKSNLFLNSFLKKNLILWIKDLFIENEKYSTNKFFLKNKKISKFGSNFFSNILSVDELNLAFSTTKKPKNKFKIVKRQENKIFRRFLKSNNYRFIFFWKIKAKYKNLNSFIFLDYAYKIIYEERNNLKKFVPLIKYKAVNNVFSLLWFFIHKYISITNYIESTKYNKNLLFQNNYFVNLPIFLDTLNLFIIKYNLFYTKTANLTLNYGNKKKFESEKKLLTTKIIYEKNQAFMKNNLKTQIEIYNIFLKFHIEVTNYYGIVYDKFYKYPIKFSKNLFLINKLFYYRKKINLERLIKIIIDPNLLKWKKKEKNYFSFFHSNTNEEQDDYIYYYFNKYTRIDEEKKKKKAFKFSIEKKKNLLFLSNKIKFLNNKNLIGQWSHKINRKTIYIFYKNFISVFKKNINKISKQFIYFPKIINTKKKSEFFFFNKNILLEQVTFNIYYKLNTYFYFDEILISNFLIDYFNTNKNKIGTEKFNSFFFTSIGQNEKIYFSSMKISNKILLNSQFSKANTLKLFNFLYYSKLSYKKNLNFYLEKEKKNNLTYTKLIKNIAIAKFFLSNNQLDFFYTKLDENSNIKSEIYKTFVSRNFEQFNYRKFIFLYKFNFSKLFASLVKFNPVFYKIKKDLEKIDLDKIPSIKNTLEKKNVHEINYNYFKNYLLSEFFINLKNENNKIVNWINKLFIIKLNSGANLIDIVSNNDNNNNIFNNKKFNDGKKLSFFIDPIKLIPRTKIHQIFRKSVKWTLFEKYILWFFTFKWWNYLKNILLNLFSELLLNINDQFNYSLPTILQNKIRKLECLLKIALFNLKNKIIGNSFESWKLRLLKQADEQSNNQQIIWPSFSFNFVVEWNKQYIATISFIIFIYFVFKKYFSSLLGSDYFELWRSFEIIQSLIDSSHGKYLDSLIYNNSIQFIKSENILTHLFRNLKHYIKNVNFYIFTKRKINKLLINNKGVDLSRRERKLLVQSLVTGKSIEQYRSGFTSNTNSIIFQFGTPIVKQKKSKNYLENLTENYQKNLVNYPFNQFYLAENLVFLSSWQKTTFLPIPWQINTLRSTLYKKPVPLELRLFSSKGILLIGSLETGRSHLVKNLAANSFVPLIKISINKLLYNKPDIITESWINILMESLRRLNLILELAKKLSPCIVWIQNIHELNVDRSTQNVESDPTFLLGTLSKIFQTGLNKKETHNIVIIASTHFPKKVDPALISPNRLDRLINIRMFNILQRKKKISILLHSKNSKYFYSKNKNSSINEFGYRTIGYNARDLSGLINEILLISIAQNRSMIEKKTIRLAFYRQTLGSTYLNTKINFTQNYGILFYKVGKVLIQNLFIKNSSRNPLYFGNDLWRKKFYYLSKWYLEPSIFESTIKELTILPHILSCLAGLAARDSWFILENKSDNLISLDKHVENDFYLACNILESLLIEFSWLEISEKKDTDKENNFNFQFRSKNPLHMIKKGLFSVIDQNAKNILLTKSFDQKISYKKELYQLTSNITWAPKIPRLDFIRSNLFDWTDRPNEFKVTYNSDFSKKKEKKEFNGPPKNSQFLEIVRHKTKEQLPYERVLSRIRRRNVQELESQLEDLSLEEQFVILGFSRSSTEYRIEFRLSSKPMLFIGGRFLWDPTGLFFRNHNFMFSRQNIFIDEEMLRRLYVTYGARREREKSRSSQKMKQFFLRRGYGRDSINDFSINWWNNLPFIERNNIETFKRIEGIGVQLKRPQVFTPVYLYQRWLIEDPLETMTRFDLLNHQQRWLKINNLLFNDSFIYSTLLEIYQYLLHFFISHQILLNKMTKILLRNKWLFQNEIEYFINGINKTN